MINDLEISRTLLAVMVLLISALSCGGLFHKLRQPPVVGEIFAGILLGPTLFGLVAPNLFHEVFYSTERIGVVVSTIYNFGFLLLLFLSGMEMQSQFAKGERRLTLALGLGGCLLPLLIGLVALTFIDVHSFMGTAQNALALKIVFAISMAITSLPVLARIFMDLGIMQSAFAKLALSAAVIDDIVLYVVLACALSLVTPHEGSAGGLVGSLVANLDLAPRLACIAVANSCFLLVCVFALKPVFKFFERTLLSNLAKRSPIALLILVAVSTTIISIRLGVPQVLGAFCGGLIAAGLVRPTETDKTALKNFSFSFFVPLYFAVVGFRLNLLRDFQPWFFLVLLCAASAIKGLSIFVSAKLAGAGNTLARNMAVTLNARGGPGIVLASVSLDAGILNKNLYTSFVLLALVTSMMAGAWLNRVLRKNHALI